MFWKVANCAGDCPATLGPRMAPQVADSDWEHVHCSQSPAPASGTAGNCFLRVQAPGERSFSVPAVTHIPPGAQLPPLLIIPGGLVLCSWIKPGQLSLTPAKLHTEPEPLLRFVSGENLMCSRQVPRQVCTEQRFAETTGDWPGRPGRVSAGLRFHVWKRKGPYGGLAPSVPRSW